MEYVTMKQMYDDCGIARSTVYKRAKALNIKFVRIKTPGSGQPPLAVTSKDFDSIKDFDPHLAKQRNIYKTASNKSNESRKFVAWKATPSHNRENGYYQRITPSWMISCHQKMSST